MVKQHFAKQELNLQRFIELKPLILNKLTHGGGSPTHGDVVSSVHNSGGIPTHGCWNICWVQSHNSKHSPIAQIAIYEAYTEIGKPHHHNSEVTDHLNKEKLCFAYIVINLQSEFQRSTQV